MRPLLAHVERTENDGRERIAVLGAIGRATPPTVLDDAGGVADDRIVLVAPGQLVAEPGSTGAGRAAAVATAAVVAGRLATLAPHVSLTNQTLPIVELDRELLDAPCTATCC